MANRFLEKYLDLPFDSYDDYMSHLFAIVNNSLDSHLRGMKKIFATEQGGYKNVLYPDLEIAHDLTKSHIEEFENAAETEETGKTGEADSKEDFFEEDSLSGVSDELKGLLDGFSAFEEDDEDEAGDVDDTENDTLPLGFDGIADYPAEAVKDTGYYIGYVQKRGKLTVEKGIRMPFFTLVDKRDFDPFTIFSFVAALLSSTQTNYAGIFQVINENGNLAAPTIESAARLYYGKGFTITKASASMSLCLEQLSPVMDLQVMTSMPFSTPLSPDKRLIDYMFGSNPYKLDENYSRYFRMLTDDKELDPIIANGNILDAMKISYEDGIRLFAYFGDEGSGRKFFVKHFCRERGMSAITINCKKLFSADLGFVDKALWALTRECILTDSCACLEDLAYREEEKDKFFTCMDFAFMKLVEKNITVFAMSKEELKYKEITKEMVTTLTLPTPNTSEREECWRYYGSKFELDDDVDLFEMTTKFLFTPGKVYDALRHARNLTAMEKLDKIPRALLFKGCNAQMSSELAQKATRVEAKFGFDDIVMNEDQRETITHAIEQMMYKKQVYEEWNYTKKYPYGRGLTVLLFGAPGTGKSMMAQVLAHELNLELYRVDISKVVDKYVGETEKSLSMIFREAKKCNVVLFFDECDTIFAKRSDDGGSNQASANNKTALLLQEMEAYDGVCVLATNYKHNIDPAFFRRMKYIVEFQFPNPDTREMLWKTTVPKTTPLGEDVDFRFIAEKFEFAGGNIKNCILNAAFLAAADPDAHGEVCMRHYLKAIRYEYVKTGKVFTRSDFEPYAEEVFGE